MDNFHQYFFKKYCMIYDFIMNILKIFYPLLY